jgi:A/G-specific adenine glycosylase
MPLLAGRIPEALPVRAHVFTHFRLEIHPFLYRIETLPLRIEEADWAWLPLGKAAQAGLPAPMARLVEEIRERIGR